MSISNHHSVTRTALGMLAAMGLLLSTLLMVTPVLADGNNSSTECTAMAINVDASDADQSADEVTVDAGAGLVVTAICIKSGDEAFGDEQHSGVIDADGPVDACYTVGGIGTQTVTVTKADTDNCKGISHVDATTAAVQSGSPSASPSEGGNPDTEITKTSSVTVVVLGDTYSYTLTIHNDGKGEAINVHAWDDLDDDLTVVSVTPSQGTCDPVGPNNEVDCWLGNMAPDALATIVIVVDTDDAECEDVENRGYVDADNEGETSRSNRVTVTISCESPSESESSTASPSASPSESASESPSESASPSASPSEGGGELGGNPTPTPGGGTLPDTAVGSTSVPAWPFALLFMMSLSCLLVLRLTAEASRSR